MLLGPLAAVQCVPLGGCRPVNRHQTPPSSRTLRSTNSRQYLHALDCIDTQAYHSLPPQQSGRSRSLDRDTASTDAGGQLEGARCGWRMCDRHTAGRVVDVSLNRNHRMLRHLHAAANAAGERWTMWAPLCRRPRIPDFRPKRGGSAWCRSLCGGSGTRATASGEHDRRGQAGTEYTPTDW